MWDDNQPNGARALPHYPKCSPAAAYSPKQTVPAYKSTCSLRLHPEDITATERAGHLRHSAPDRLSAAGFRPDCDSPVAGARSGVLSNTLLGLLAHPDVNVGLPAETTLEALPIDCGVLLWTGALAAAGHRTALRHPSTIPSMRRPCASSDQAHGSGRRHGSGFPAMGPDDSAGLLLERPLQSLGCAPLSVHPSNSSGLLAPSETNLPPLLNPCQDPGTGPTALRPPWALLAATEAGRSHKRARPGWEARPVWGSLRQASNDEQSADTLVVPAPGAEAGSKHDLASSGASTVAAPGVGHGVGRGRGAEAGLPSLKRGRSATSPSSPLATPPASALARSPSASSDAAIGCHPQPAAAGPSLGPPAYNTPSRDVVPHTSGPHAEASLPPPVAGTGQPPPPPPESDPGRVGPLRQRYLSAQEEQAAAALQGLGMPKPVGLGPGVAVDMGAQGGYPRSIFSTRAVMQAALLGPPVAIPSDAAGGCCGRAPSSLEEQVRIAAPAIAAAAAEAAAAPAAGKDVGGAVVRGLPCAPAERPAEAQLPTPPPAGREPAARDSAALVGPRPVTPSRRTGRKEQRSPGSPQRETAQLAEILPPPRAPSGDPNRPAGREALHEALIYFTTKYYLDRGLPNK